MAPNQIHQVEQKFLNCFLNSWGSNLLLDNSIMIPIKPSQIEINKHMDAKINANSLVY